MIRTHTQCRSTTAFILLCLIISAFSVQPLDAQSRKKQSKGRTEAATTQTGKHILWRVQGDSVTSYIMGSMHILPSEFYPLDSILDRVYDSASVLVLELQLDSAMILEMQQKMLTIGFYTDGRTLKSTLSPKTYKLVKARLKDMGLPMVMAERLKPWVVGLLLNLPNASESGFSAEVGVDMHFSQRAQEDGKPIIGLETLDQQLELFNTMSDKDQEAMLLQALEEKDMSESMIMTMAKAWQKGDVKSIERMSNDMLKSDSASYRRLLLDRNNAWLPKVEGYLKEGKRYLVVVGAAHLVGHDGVIEMLRRRGWHIEQL